METRLTLRPGKPGTRKLVEMYGERLLRVRYVYDAAAGRRLKTVELVIESVPWNARARKPRRSDDDVAYVRIAYHEADLRERAKRLGAIWRQPQKLREITSRDSKRLGIEDRNVERG
jgi:serine kinase of HPr protein (carbohydrate metabolism regulator)